MVDLCMHYNEGSVQLKEIARRQKVSLKYLEQLVTPLRAAGLVRGVRGARGGYTLSRPPEDINLGEILQALEGSLAPVDCAADETICPAAGGCATHELWQELYVSVNKVLERRTLKDLATRQTELEREGRDAFTYQI